MNNTRKLSRIFLAFSLLLSLGVAPTLSVYGQTAHKQFATQAESPAAKTQQASPEKKQASEDDSLPLSDAEMEKVEGGFFWAAVPIVIGTVSLGVGVYNAVHGHRAEERILRACTPTRRR